MAGAETTLSLQDVADLARVQRAVVSMWRRRPQARHVYLPFPDPVSVVDRVEQFSRDAVVDWLQRTGRGKNPEAALDAPALSPPDGVSLDELVTLLCLRASTGEELYETTPADRLNLAETADPHDEFLVREVEGCTASKRTLQFIDDLMEASYGPAEALDILEHGRVARAFSTRDLTPGAVDMVRTVAEACALHLAPEGVPLVHSGAADNLTLAIAHRFAFLVTAPCDSGSRALRRRAVIREIDTISHTVSPHVRLLSVVGTEPEVALDAIDNVMLELSDLEMAVILGPASLLCDRLRSDHERNRAQTLRGGGLVLALRLTRGMWREAHRQALGLWVCAAGKLTRRPLVADLAAFAPVELDAQDLASDVAGALAATGARAYRYLRPHDLPLILSARSAVVPRGVRAIQLATDEAQDHLSKITAATLLTREGPPTFDVLAEAAPGAVVLRTRSLGELKDLGRVRVIRGSRIDHSLADPAGTVDVLSADDATEALRLDPIDVARHYLHAARTEPGDVIFNERPPRARVDDRGGSLVTSPSRILRLSPRAGVLPRVVAAIIEQLPDRATEWPTWNVPVLDDETAQNLDHALAAAADYESALRDRLAAVRVLTKSMINGVAAGAVTLSLPIAD